MKKTSLFCKWKAILAAGALAHGLRRRIVALAVPLAAIFAAFLPAAAQAQAVPNVQWSSINPIQMAIDTPYTVALTLTNNGNQVADDGLINVSLPTGITLSGAPPTGCTATATGFSCSWQPWRAVPLTIARPTMSSISLFRLSRLLRCMAAAP